MCGAFRLRVASGRSRPLADAQPQWRRDGRELFYISPDRKLMAVEVKANGSTFEAGVPKALFEPALPMLSGYWKPYAITADGQRFLITTLLEEATSSPITVVHELDGRPETMSLDAGTKLGRYEIRSQTRRGWHGRGVSRAR